MPLDLCRIRPGQDSIRGELAAVVAAQNVVSLTIMLGQPRSATRRSSSRATRMPDSGCIRDQGEAFPAAVTHDGVDAEAATISELIGYKIERPARVGPHRDRHGRPRPDVAA